MADNDGAPSSLELLAVIVLSVTAVLTAWSGFESSKWGGEMSIAFSQASTARIEAARHDAQADAERGFDLNIFGVYVQAVAADNEQLQDFVEQRFTDHFQVAFDAWMALDPLNNPDAPPGPFTMPEYQPPGEALAAEADARADDLFAQALENNQRGDDYTLMTVLFALVLFLTAVSQRLRAKVLTSTVIGGAIILLIVGIGFLIAMPKII